MFAAAIALCVGGKFMPSPVAKADTAIPVNAQVLDDKKAEAKAELAAYFNTFTQSDYAAAEWAELDRMESEGCAFIDSATDAKEINEIVAGIKYAADGVLTEAEKPAFAAYVAQASQNVGSYFNPALYREAEQTEGAAIIAQAQAALATATSYAQAEALELSALAKLDGLKTAAQWQAEEEAAKENQNQSTPNNPEEQDRTVEKEESGCGSVVGGIWQMVIVAGVSSMVMIKTKRKE